MRRATDIAAALAGVLLLSPLLLILSLWVLADSGRPLFHREQRLGMGGVPFTLFKFRSMVPSGQDAPSVAPEDDPRITRSGLWLRRWRLDELAQVFNLLRGDISVVGPRPLPLRHARHVAAGDLERLLAVRPGLTGPASLAFLAEDAVLAGRDEAEALYLAVILPAKVRLQLEYLEDSSPWRDWLVLWRTLTQVWSRAARRRSAAMIRGLLAEGRSA